MAGALLQVRNFSAAFQGGTLTAVDRVSFDVGEHEIVGIVGESGCGKSVLAQSVLRLGEHTTDVAYKGEILWAENGAAEEMQNLLALPLAKMRRLRGRSISMVFQDPLSSLNPVFTVGDQVAETLRLHRVPRPGAAEAKTEAIALMEQLGISESDRRFSLYPHELSGGMQQRIMIAIALAGEPRLLIADEPTTALDTTIQAQILALIRSIHERKGMSVLFISHDLGVIASVCARVVVMYLGQIMEEAPASELFSAPAHPYTQGLLRSIPALDGTIDTELRGIEGMVPPLSALPPGCRFAPRCPRADDACRRSDVPTVEVGKGHRVKCRRS